MLFRSSSLLRLLLTASLPLTVAGGAAVLPLAALGGCGCGETETVFPIPREDHESLLKRYGSDGLPQSECQRICVLPSDFVEDAGADGGVPSAPPGPFSVHSCALTTFEWETPAVRCTGAFDCGGSGRRPAGLLAANELAPSIPALGAHFARAARLEAASVPAFLDLAEELTAHGAPPSLVRWAVRAAVEEIGHARGMAHLARVHGAAPLLARITPRPARDLEAMARENATEGCVFEAFGAVLLAHQARHAGDPALRPVLAAIAADEARHAELSRRIHAWAASRLDPRARRRLAEAREEAAWALARAHEAEPTAALAGGLGLPSAERAQALLGALAA